MRCKCRQVHCAASIASLEWYLYCYTSRDSLGTCHLVLHKSRRYRDLIMVVHWLHNLPEQTNFENQCQMMGSSRPPTTSSMFGNSFSLLIHLSEGRNFPIVALDINNKNRQGLDTQLVIGK